MKAPAWPRAARDLDADAALAWLRNAWPRWRRRATWRDAHPHPLAPGELTTRRPGVGLDLADLRPQQPGEDARRIAWGPTARRGQPIAKTYCADADAGWWFVLDASPSLRFGPAEAPWHDAWKLRAALSSIGQAAAAGVSAGLALGFATLQAGVAAPPGRGEAPVFAGFLRCARLALATATVPSKDAATPPPPTGMATWMVSDFLRTATLTAARRAAQRVATRAIVVEHPWERALPDAGLCRWRERATGRVLTVDTSSPRVRAEFSERARQRRLRLAAAFRLAGVAEFPAHDDDGLTDAG